MAIAITRGGPDASGLRSAAARSKDAAALRRMLALALVLQGATRTARRKRQAWTGKTCAIGCIATMNMGWTVMVVKGVIDEVFAYGFSAGWVVSGPGRVRSNG